ncbi:MAG: thiolase family protein [Candidatus Bipolaricaulota bacterium]|nr:thiolase family protein [Candidatus Bipolaricaulota bacterium]MCS7274175.1 thiolase family protein [Candidatus Bipolaricaulota bacterium]MDW8110081.1 thiolase family protein [Candidatus Bipolaricaulota bacterium]MDW8328999.1 thiolase family protein [Candidatus Bipolaricaulota bacterium]
MPREALILTGVRTPFGKFMGGLSNLSAIQLAAHVTKHALQKADISPSEVEHVIFGNVLQTSSDAIYLARHAGLYAGVPVHVPALTVNRLCGSGLEAIVQGARLVQTGEADLVVAGGAENMTQAPFMIRGARFGLRLGSAKLEDYLWEALLDPYCNFTMAGTANNLAEKYGISREEQDEFALRSHQRAVRAMQSGYFKEEIAPIEIDQKGKKVLLDTDEHPRADTTLEGLAKLPLAPFPGNKYVTAGNASGINDGAAAVIVASPEKSKALGIKPWARVVSWAQCGVEPKYMGIGPVPASQRALERAKLSMKDIALWEINEAFAAQYLAVERELKLDRERVNVNGGAIALGHPLGASGARLALTLIHELRRRKAQFGVASLCIGGGQGIAAVFEAL